MFPNVPTCFFDWLFKFAIIGFVTLCALIVGGAGFIIWWCINHVRFV